MTESRDPAFDWAATRGERWRASLSGMEAMLAPIDEPLLQALQLDAPLRIADLACGGGGTTLAIARRAPPGSVVHGFDIAPGLIDDARARAASEQQGVDFSVADLQTATPPEGPYDRLSARFGVMFFADPPAAFCNLARWLRPGGRFAFTVWGRFTDNLLATIVRDVVAELVPVPPMVPDAPGPYRYADPEPLLSLLRAAGFVDVTVHDWRGDLPIGGGLPASEAARFVLSSTSFADPLAHASADLRDQAHRALTARFTPHLRDGIVRLEARVHVVTGAG